MRRCPRAAIPDDREGRIAWLLAEWQRVDDAVDDRRGRRDRAGLADPLDAQRVGGRRGDGVAEGDGRHVARRRDEVLGEAGVLEVAVGVVDELLHQRLGDARRDAAGVGHHEHLRRAGGARRRAAEVRRERRDRNAARWRGRRRPCRRLWRRQ